MRTLKSFDERKVAQSIEALEKQLNAELKADDEMKEEETLEVQQEADDLLDSDEDDLDEGELDDDLDDFDDFDDETIKIEEGDDEVPAEEPAEEENLNDEIEEVETEVEKQEIVTACREVQASIAMLERKASEEKKGIEDEIGDEAHGGDPSVSEVAPGGDDVDVSTDKEVFPTNSEFVAKITRRLDRVASELEKRGMKRMAFRVDQLTDKIESSIR